MNVRHLFGGKHNTGARAAWKKTCIFYEYSCIYIWASAVTVQQLCCAALFVKNDKCKTSGSDNVLYVVECAECCPNCTMSGKDNCDGPGCKDDYYRNSIILCFSKFQRNILSNGFVCVLVRLGWLYDERCEMKIKRKDGTVDKTELAVNTPKSTFFRFQQIQKSVAGTVVKDTTLCHSTFIYTLYQLVQNHWTQRIECKLISLAYKVRLTTTNLHPL